MANDLEQAADEAAPVPKLAIWHLLLWMFGVALICAWQRAWYGQIDLPSRWQQLWWGAQWAGSGLELAALLLAVYGLFVRPRYFPIAAGHWLLIVGGLSWMMDYASDVIATTCVAKNWQSRDDCTHPIFVVVFGLDCAVCVWAAMAMRDSWPWRLAMLGYGMLPGCWAIVNAIWLFYSHRLGDRLSTFGMSWQNHLLRASVIAILLVAAGEFYRGRRRDWLHWTGVLSAATRLWLF